MPCFDLADHFVWSKSNITSQKLPFLLFLHCISPWDFSVLPQKSSLEASVVTGGFTNASVYILSVDFHWTVLLQEVKLKNIAKLKYLITTCEVFLFPGFADGFVQKFIDTLSLYCCMHFIWEIRQFTEFNRMFNNLVLP